MLKATDEDGNVLPEFEKVLDGEAAARRPFRELS